MCFRMQVWWCQCIMPLVCMCSTLYGPYWLESASAIQIWSWRNYRGCSQSCLPTLIWWAASSASSLCCASLHLSSLATSSSSTFTKGCGIISRSIQRYVYLRGLGNIIELFRNFLVKKEIHIVRPCLSVSVVVQFLNPFLWGGFDTKLFIRG